MPLAEDDAQIGGIPSEEHLKSKAFKLAGHGIDRMADMRKKEEEGILTLMLHMSSMSPPLWPSWPSMGCMWWLWSIAGLFL